jgi:DNA-binding MarR family transcriptional regulator
MNAGVSIIPAAERAAHQLSLLLERALSSMRLTQAETHVLGHLAQRHPSSIGEIHKSFGHKRSTLTSVLDRLEARSLLRRAVDPANRRSVVVSLTPTGARAARRVDAVIAELERGLSSRVTERDLHGYRAVLGAIDQEVEGA